MFTSLLSSSARGGGTIRAYLSSALQNHHMTSWTAVGCVAERSIQFNAYNKPMNIMFQNVYGNKIFFLIMFWIVKLELIR